MSPRRTQAQVNLVPRPVRRGFAAAASTGNKVSLTVNPSDTYRNGIAGPGATVRLRTAGGTNILLAGVVVTVQMLGTGSIVSTPSAAVTDASGIATFSGFTISGTTSGTNIVFQATGYAQAIWSGVALTGGVPVASQTTAVVGPGAVAVNHVITTTTRDAVGNLVAVGGSLVAMTVSGANTVATSTAVDHGDGTYDTNYTPSNAGLDFVTLRLGGTQISGSPYQSVVAATGGGPGIPFGAWSINSKSDATAVFGRQPSWDSSFIGFLSTGNCVDVIDFYATNGWKLGIRLWNDVNTKDGSGTFNLNLWKAAVQAYANAGLASYLNSRSLDGTIIRHVLMDDIHSLNRWKRFITNSELEEMAKFSRILFPSLPVTIRARATQLTGFPWVWLKDVICHYVFPLGGVSQGSKTQQQWRIADCTAYKNAEVAAGNTLGYRVCFGLNWINGGDGSSGIAGDGSPPGKWKIGAQELRDYADILVPHPGTYWWNSWKWDSAVDATYFDLTAIKASMAYTKTLCDVHP